MRSVIFLYAILGVFSYYRKRIKSPLVLFWHDVADNASISVEGESFSPSVFMRQISYLKKHYEIISMDEFYKRYTTNSFTNKEVVLTFDDGYKNNLLTVAPILKKYNLPFTVFVSANNVEQQKRFYVSIPRLVIVGGELEQIDIPMLSYNKACKTKSEREQCAHEIEYKIKYIPHEDAVKVSDFLISLIGSDKFDLLCKKYPHGELLTWNDVITLSKDYGCTIGSHCMDHCICNDTQDEELVKQQIIESKQLIVKRIGLECKYFAYPNGDHTDYSDSIVNLYYKMGFSTERMPVFTERNVGSVGRIGVPSSFYIFQHAITLGLYKKYNNI